MNLRYCFRLPCLATLLLAITFTITGCSKSTDSAPPIEAFNSGNTLPAGHPPMPAASETAPRAATAQAPSARSVKVSVRVSPELSAKVGANDALYIFARAAKGPTMPLAIVRRAAKELPLTVTLDDSMAMVPEMKLSSVQNIVVGARIAKSGDAIAKPGDLEGFTLPLKGNTAEVVIASVVSATAKPAATPAPDAHAAAGFNHPASGSKTRLNIPAEVKAKWKSVELSLAGKVITAGTQKIAVGGEHTLGPGLALRVLAYVPAFQSDAGTVTSSSNNPDNPAVLVQLLDNQQPQGEGWVFQKLPDFNTFKSDRVQVKLLGAKGD